MEGKKNRRLAAIMFTDIVGYTALMQQDESVAAAVRTRHRQIFDTQHQLHQGKILQYFGDGTLSVFQSGVEAVECAISIQKELRTGEVVPLRIGLHIGDIVFDGTEIYGDGVNLASRIESMGVPGAILLSGKLNDELKNHPQISTSSLGHFELKNISKPVEVFTVTNEGLRIAVPSELKGKQKKQTKTIAVLPFVNLSADQDNEYFSDGMTEEIINALAKIKGLKVTSRTSSFHFKNKNIPIPQIGKALNVSTILEGSIRLAGNKMRITAQLIDVADDFHFWSETFDRSIDDVFAVQDEISLLIADKLREHIGHFDIDEKLVDAPEVSVAVYKKYLKGRYHILKMGKTDIEMGISMLKKVIQNQPNFALAYLGMHLGHNLLGIMGLISPEEAFLNSKSFLDKAIKIDETLPECQLHLSYDAFLQQWDLAATYQHLQKSFEIRPTVEYYQSMASTLVAERKFEAARNYIEIALQLDPFSEINHHLKGFIYYSQEQYPEAIEYFEKAAQLKSTFLPSVYYWGQTLILMDRKEEALTFFKRFPEGQSGDLTKLGFVTLAHAALKNKQQLEEGIAKLEAALESGFASRAISALMLIYATLGNQEKALEMVEKAIGFRLPMMVYLYTEPILKPLYAIPRFQELVRKVLGEATTFNVKKRKYKKVLFDEESLQQYQEKLEQLVVKEKPYLNPDLTLRELAKMLEIPPNHLSQLLNEGFDKNFSEYVNSYRLEAFKAKVADPALQHLTILGLAYESGFNSKTVFNTFFKKTMGKTPKAYWKEVVK